MARTNFPPRWTIPTLRIVTFKLLIMNIMGPNTSSILLFGGCQDNDILNNVFKVLEEDISLMLMFICKSVFMNVSKVTKYYELSKQRTYKAKIPF